mmetsp:Transcript_26951/g.88437  ORF Transcript_26951/g.88437 Transcript_26951/m.88437 type:complete len:204 (-) Transcript_26951:1111-1722(-)
MEPPSTESGRPPLHARPSRVDREHSLAATDSNLRDQRSRTRTEIFCDRVARRTSGRRSASSKRLDGTARARPASPRLPLEGSPLVRRTEPLISKHRRHRRRRLQRTAAHRTWGRRAPRAPGAGALRTTSHASSRRRRRTTFGAEITKNIETACPEGTHRNSTRARPLESKIKHQLFFFGTMTGRCRHDAILISIIKDACSCLP